MNILFTDPQPLNFINPAPGGTTPLPDDVADTNLLTVFSLDNLNQNLGTLDIINTFIKSLNKRHRKLFVLRLIRFSV